MYEINKSDDKTAIPQGKPQIEVSLILPVYNEAKNLATLLPALKAILPSCTKSFEIIVVDAGSEDDGVKIVKESGVRVFVQKQKNLPPP